VPRFFTILLHLLPGRALYRPGYRHEGLRKGAARVTVPAVSPQPASAPVPLPAVPSLPGQGPGSPETKLTSTHYPKNQHVQALRRMPGVKQLKHTARNTAKPQHQKKGKMDTLEFFVFLLILAGLSALAGIVGGPILILLLQGLGGYGARAAIFSGLSVALAVFNTALIAVVKTDVAKEAITLVVPLVLILLAVVASVFTWLALFGVGYFATQAFYGLAWHSFLFLAGLALVLTTLYTTGIIKKRKFLP
jgi:hypothetical protein